MRRGMVVALLIALVAAGCGDDGESSSTTTAPPSEDTTPAFERDACGLLTDDQAGEVLGDAVTKESTPGDAEMSQPAACTWSAPDADVDFADPQPTGITVFLGDRQIYDNTQVLAEQDDSYEELDGIGDEAYAGGAEGGVLVGEVGVTVTPIGTDANDPATHDLIVDLLDQLAENV